MHPQGKPNCDIFCTPLLHKQMYFCMLMEAELMNMLYDLDVLAYQAIEEAVQSHYREAATSRN